MEAQRPHAVCIPSPAQGHICAMLKLAKLLHHKGFHITFVLTQLNYTHIMEARDFRPLNQAPTFRFQTIPDGILSRESRNSATDMTEIISSISKNCYAPFRELIHKLMNVASSSDVIIPPVSCIVSDALMSSTTIGAAQELGIPAVMFWPFSGVGSMLHLYSPQLREKVSINKADNYIIDWIPGVKSICLGDIPTTVWSPNPNDPIIDYAISQVSGSYKASVVIFHTFDELEPEVCNALGSMFNRAYTIGPIPLLLKGFPETDEVNKIECHMWKEDHNCFQWLDSKTPKSVVYVNFGSMAVTSPDKLVELAIGLCKSMQNFLWIIRPELISDDWSKILPPEFMDAIKGGRGYVAAWCDQEQVLNHSSVGGFLTHCGWNSIVESMSAGVAMICWSCFAEQQINRLCCCSQWGFGLEIDLDVNRENVESVVRELIEGEKGREAKQKALFWKERGEAATAIGGSSFLNLDKLIGEVLLSGGK